MERLHTLELGDRESKASLQHPSIRSQRSAEVSAQGSASEVVDWVSMH